jgi:hypothetical protein
MRVYVPVTVDVLRKWHTDDILAAPVSAWAVTDELRTQLSELAEEEVEFAVAVAAAEASRQQLAERRIRRGRRMVVVAEISYSVVGSAGETPGEVMLENPVEGRRIAAVLADGGDIDVASSVDNDDLAWFAAQEIPDLLA